jgi:hypothetical protein
MPSNQFILSYRWKYACQSLQWRFPSFFSFFWLWWKSKSSRSNGKMREYKWNNKSVTFLSITDFHTLGIWALLQPKKEEEKREIIINKYCRNGRVVWKWWVLAGKFFEIPRTIKSTMKFQRNVTQGHTPKSVLEFLKRNATLYAEPHDNNIYFARNYSVVEEKLK